MYLIYIRNQELKGCLTVSKYLSNEIRLTFVQGYHQLMTMIEIALPRTISVSNTSWDNTVLGRSDIADADAATHHSSPHNLPPQQLYTTVDEFTVESGEKLLNATVAFTFRSLPNSARDNAGVICYASSGSADAGDWWSSLLTRSNPALGPNKFCIICCNSLGSPYGSVSPPLYLSGSGQTMGRHGLAFPRVPFEMMSGEYVARFGLFSTLESDYHHNHSIRKHVMDILGVKSIHCVMSMGGMLALEWSFFDQEYVRSVVLIATAARQSVWQWHGPRISGPPSNAIPSSVEDVMETILPWPVLELPYGCPPDISHVPILQKAIWQTPVEWRDLLFISIWCARRSFLRNADTAAVCLCCRCRVT